VSSLGLYPEFMADGKMITANGTPNGVRVVRLNPDGRPDDTFGDNGSISVELGLGGGEFDVTVQPGGKVIVGGWIGQPNAATTKLLRLNVNGTVDPTFGDDGTGVITGPTARTYLLDAAGDGSLLATSHDGFLRFNAGGDLDASFGGDGKLTVTELGLRYDNAQPFGAMLARDTPKLDSDGRILVPAIKTSADGSTNLGPGVMRIGMDSTEYDPARKQLFIQGTDAGDTIVVDPGTGDDVIVRINGVQTTIAGGVLGIQARLGLGANHFLAGTGVNAAMLVNGSPSNDTIITGGGPDTIYNQGSADSILAGAGNDIIAHAAEALHGGGGGLRIDAGPGNDSIYGSHGNDAISGGAGNDWISAAGANDWIAGDAGEDFIDAHNGSDTVWGGDGLDSIYGGKGSDILHGNANPDTVDGEAGDDRIWGDVSKDSLLGGDGDDFLHGGEANDRLFGGAGDDHLRGDRDNDVLLGNEGHDDLSDPLGTNYLHGGDGNDLIDGHESFPNTLIDTLIGGAGSDIGWYEVEDLVTEIEVLHLIS
jgi:uncharacterized delta-60 repeat protein